LYSYSRKATARVSTPHLLFPRLYYERAWEAISVVIVEAGVDAGMGWDPCGRLSLLYTYLLEDTQIAQGMH
jgi:hypothetical protein